MQRRSNSVGNKLVVSTQILAAYGCQLTLFCFLQFTEKQFADLVKYAFVVFL